MSGEPQGQDNKCIERDDDFSQRRLHLSHMSEQQLHQHFWRLAEKIVEPLIEEARSHTSPSIERSVLLRMGFSSVDAKQLVEQMQSRQLLAYGAGRLILELSQRRDISVAAAGKALLQGNYWQELIDETES